MANNLFIVLEENMEDVEDYLLLHHGHPNNLNLHLELPYFKYERFSLEDLAEEECSVEMRFKKQDIYNLVQALHLPEVYRCYNGVIVDPVEALCVCLKRFAYPSRYADLVPRFGRPVPQLCMIFNLVIDDIFDRFSHLLSDLNQPWLSRENLQSFADAIHNKGAALDNCWGFVDGTVRPICRPTRNQRAVYNGHKRVHALKFQSVVAPNGMIANLFGPVEGRRHDSRLLVMSGLLEQLEQHSFSPDGVALCIYGDPAYPHRVHLQRPFARRAELAPNELAFNQSMSQVRISVEWLFGDIINYFKFLDFKKNLKIGLSSVGKFYVVGALLRNALTCLYGNNTAKFFEVIPPTLNEYFL
ncbi:uncharacterized protein LOC135694309 [Rhopilema esculentum]|uniref:uncharacterized protein LOC135694309 n=1 Tax=Rhopilema esculentum TaxID=499914 RepID=UPI0031DB7CE9|eukprot:gene4472-biopygen12169